MLLVLWGCLEGRAVSLLLLASGSTLKIWCSFIAASSLTVLCCQNINPPPTSPSLLFFTPPPRPPTAMCWKGLWSVFVAPGQPWSEYVKNFSASLSFLIWSVFSPLSAREYSTVLGAERRKSARPRAKQLVINRKKLWFKRNETVKGFLTWSWHVLLIKSTVEMRNIKVVLLKKDIPICFVLNQKDQPKCMNGSDHFQC